MGNCQKCQFYSIDYEFDTYYMSTIAVEKCTKKNKIFTKNCIDFEMELK